MKNKVTAAVVIINRDGDILGCHGTGKPKDSGFDFPKGLVEPGETDVQAAIRELLEETGQYAIEDDLIDCGVHPHNKEKDIHIFVWHQRYITPWACKCTSFFELNGKQYPEIDRFEIITKKNRNMFNRVLQNKFGIIDDCNEKYKEQHPETKDL